MRKNIFRRFAEDIRNFDKRNENESVVLRSHFFSFYKGKPVLRTNMARSGSFGMLFISRREEQADKAKDIVRHEYGHTLQLKQLGVYRYIRCIFIPSWKMWGPEKYYDKPWEATADILGGVKHRKPSALVGAKGFRYLDDVKKNGAVVLKTIDKNRRMVK